ncbi:MAG: hypothetical protein K5872_04305 [Rhizobiaceae bacterium]|nr:hypothetical protein [Rhizobiaceae bacterium]MCV0405433.1 hypothetical protein [Rhizobiaceae bacterium]
MAGAYSYSDELGGFSITGISGSGTRTDPVVLEQELNSASPVTMVIRAVKPIRGHTLSEEFANGFIHIRLETLNNSGLPWAEFEFELQELRGLPSLYGDGLSFDQRKVETETSKSDRFASYSRDFEPYDRLRFTDGFVDALRSVSFSLFISDFTPKIEFYLVQDPRIPSS